MASFPPLCDEIIPSSLSEDLMWKEPSAGTSRVIIGIRPMSPPPPRAQKGNPDLIAFSFLFYVDSHPTFQKTPLELFADSAPGCPFFWFLGCLSPHLPSVKAPPPFVFHLPSSACSLRMPRGLCGGWRHSFRGLLGDPGATRPFQVRMTKAGSAGYLSGL